MAKHEVFYDEQGLSTNDPWTLDEYLAEDRFRTDEKRLIKESVLSWLREYDAAGCDLSEALNELEAGLEP